MARRRAARRARATSRGRTHSLSCGSGLYRCPPSNRSQETPWHSLYARCRGWVRNESVALRGRSRLGEGSMQQERCIALVAGTPTFARRRFGTRPSKARGGSMGGEEPCHRVDPGTPRPSPPARHGRPPPDGPRSPRGPRAGFGDARRLPRPRHGGPHRRSRGGPVAAARHRRGPRLFRRDVPAARLPRRDRDPPDGRRGSRLPRGQDPGQAPRARRATPRARGVRRLLGDEVVQPAAGQVGVPDQPVAQRGPGIPPLDPHEHSPGHALRPLRARAPDRERQQLPRAAGQLLPRRPEPGPGVARPGRGADVHGDARRRVAEGAPRGHGGVLRADRLQGDGRVEGGDRLLRPREGRRRPRPRSSRTA